MSVHKKLMTARVKLLNTKLSKSGLNKFAGFQYFELSDFLPAITNIFNEVGLCGVVSFGQDLATLTIRDVDSQDEISITSPLVEVQMKGCLPIQGLGAQQTYIRRYLWVTAMEIVEHDALDATAGKEEKKGQSTPKDVWDEQTPEKQKELQIVADKVRSLLDTDLALAVGTWLDLETKEEQVAMWSRLDSKERRTIKDYQEANKKGDSK